MYDVGESKRYRTEKAHHIKKVEAPKEIWARMKPAKTGRGCEIFCSCTGEEIKTKVSTKIYENSTLEGLIPYVAESMSWHSEFVELSVGNTTARYTHRKADQSHTLLKHIQAHGMSKLRITASPLPRPETFTGSDSRYCLCDFHDCCLTCVRCESGCDYCGSDACCRCGNCGHRCCANNLSGLPSASGRRHRPQAIEN